MNKHTIAWEKWKDPWTWDEDTTDEEDGWDDSWQERESNIKTAPTGQKMVMTPMGAIPLVVENSPARTFNFWIGHTDFHLSKGVVKTVSKTTGVEAVNVYSPYRMRVAVGKLFKPSEVFHQINIAIDKYFKDRQKHRRKFGARA
jgi:hypothetical protein